MWRTCEHVSRPWLSPGARAVYGSQTVAKFNNKNSYQNQQLDTWHNKSISRSTLFTCQLQRLYFWDRFVELGIKLLVLIRIFIVEFCYNLATIAVDMDSFAVKLWAWEVLYLTVLSSMMLLNVRSGPRGAMFISYVHQHDRLPRFWDINRGNSCIWLHLLI